MRVQGTLTKNGSITTSSVITRTQLRPVADGDDKVISSSNYTIRSNVIESCSRDRLRRTRADRTGWRKPTEYYRTTVLRESLGGEVTDFLSSGDTIVWTGDAGTGSTFHSVSFNGLISAGKPVVSPSLIFRADTEALVKVKDMKVNYGEALAETRSTIRHLAKSSITLARAIKFARAGRWSRVAKELGLRKDQVLTGKAPSNRWLEYQFGWMPLLGDIKGTMDLLNEGFRKKGQTFSVVRQVQSQGLPLVQSLSDLNTSYDGTARHLCKTKMYCRVRNDNLTSLTRIGLADPFQVAWALVPFSFVVDWILPVGSYLEALSATHGVEFISGTRVRRVEFDFTASSQPSLYQQNVIRREGAFRSRHKGVSTQRDVLTKFPHPMLYVKSPFSVSHGVSALALIRSLIR